MFLLTLYAGGAWAGRGTGFRTFGAPNLKKVNCIMTIDEINKLQKENCEKFSAFAKNKLPMPGNKKYLDQILNREIFIVDFRVMESKHRENSKCLQIQFLLDNEVCIAFTGSVVLLDQITSSKDKLPFVATLTKIDKYYTLS